MSAFSLISSPHDGPTVSTRDLVGIRRPSAPRARRTTAFARRPHRSPRPRRGAGLAVASRASGSSTPRGPPSRASRASLTDCVAGRRLPHRPALEVDAEVELAGEQRHEPEDDDRAGDRDPELQPPDEVEVGLAVVEPREDRATLDDGIGHRPPPGTGATTARRPRPRATPKNGASVKSRLRLRSATDRPGEEPRGHDVEDRRQAEEEREAAHRARRSASTGPRRR